MNLLSIITINLNNASGLLQTIASVAMQQNANIEHIVIDGGSTDGSKDIIKRYNHLFAYAISEKDAGIYHAMNKGIKAAKGDYILCLNSGDTLTAANVLSRLFAATKNQAADIYHSNITIVNDCKKKAFLLKYNPQVDVSYFIKQTISHQTACIRSTLFNKLGFYNENYQLVADWAFFFKAIKNNCSFKHIDLNLSNYPLYGASANYMLANQERLHFFKNEYPEHLNAYLKTKQLNIAKRIGNKLQRMANRLNLSKNSGSASLYQSYQQQNAEAMKALVERERNQ